ncbi:MAG: thiamine phosphate synthase [Acidobacteriota bacterium]|nr:thiamine phosphate synthase [Acidobacteriota bacterium]
MLLYYITDRRQFPGPPGEQRRALLAKLGEAARAGVDYIQLREKDLSARELEQLAREAVSALARARPARMPPTRMSEGQRPTTRLLVNSRADIALAVGADGVHLPAGDLPASEVHALWAAATRNSKLETRNCLVAVSCHTGEEVAAAESHGADFAVFGPVFEKAGGPKSAGLAALRAACARGAHTSTVAKPEAGYATPMPVLALGGVTLANAQDCLRAGAAGVAGIRLFQENEVARVVAELCAREKR